jgi:hypothetical protein
MRNTLLHRILADVNEQNAAWATTRYSKDDYRDSTAQTLKVTSTRRVEGAVPSCTENHDALSSQVPHGTWRRQDHQVGIHFFPTMVS